MVGKADAVPRALEHLRGGPTDERAQAIRTLETLACNAEDRSAIIAAGGAKLLVSLLSGSGDQVLPDQKVRLANTVASLAKAPACRTVAVNAGAAESLVRLLKGSTDELVEPAAAGALVSLAPAAGARSIMVEAGAMDMLVALLQTGKNEQVQSRACELLAAILDGDNLVERSPRAFAAVAAGAIHAVLPFLASIEREGLQFQAHSVMSLLPLKNPLRSQIVRAGVFPLLVQALEKGSDRVKEKALAAVAGVVQLDPGAPEPQGDEMDIMGDAEFEIEYSDEWANSELPDLMLMRVIQFKWEDAIDASFKLDVTHSVRGISSSGAEVSLKWDDGVPTLEPIPSQEMFPVKLEIKTLEEADDAAPPSSGNLYPPDIEQLLACGVLPPLVALLESSTSELQREASHALFRLAARGDIPGQLLESGPFPALVMLMSDGKDPQTRAWAISSLRLLSTTSAARQAIEDSVPLGIDSRDKFLAKLRKLCF